MADIFKTALMSTTIFSQGIFGRLAELSFLERFAGSSAAYSLRQLSAESTDVVRVRRSSDDTEQGFSASDIDNNTMLNFVVPTGVQTKYNNAAYFGATNARVEIPISTTFFSGGNTISGTTIKPHADGNSRIFEQDAGTGQSFRLLVTDIANGQATLTFRHRFSTSGDAIWVTDSSDFNIGDVNTWSVTYDSSSTSNDPTIVINGVTQTVTETVAPVGTAVNGVGDLIIGNTSQIFGLPFQGTTYDLTVGTSEYIGDGATNANWEDQVNSNDGTVAGSPVAFTGQGFDGYVTTWYDQRVPTSQDRMYFGGSQWVNAGTLSGAIGTQDFRVVFNLFCNASTTKRIMQMGDVNSTLANNGFFVSLSGSNTITIGIDELFGDAATTRKDSGGSYEIVFDRSGNAEVFEDGVSLGTVDISSKSAISLLNQDFYIGARDVAANRLALNVGAISNIGIDIGNTGTIDHYWIGDGNLDENWQDQVGSADGTVNGSPQRCLTDLTVSNDATQTTAANQPLIVSSGVLVTENGEPAIDLDTTSKNFVINGFAPVYLDAYLVFVGTIEGSLATQKNIFDATDGTNGGFALAYGVTANKLTPYAFYDNTLTLFDGSGFDLSASTQYILSFQYKSGATADYINSSEDNTISDTWSSAGTNTFTFSTIGYDQDVAGREYTGKMQELIIYDSDQSSNRASLEANINNYYGVY